MPTLIPIFVGALLVLAACWALGMAVWRKQPPSHAIALACGAPLLSAMVFCALAVRAAKPWVLIAVCVAPLVWLAVARPALRLERLSFPVWACLPCGAYFALYLTHALTPEYQPDAAGYHLGIVAEWLRFGRFVSPIGFYDIMPLGLETLFAPAVVVGGYPAAKLIHFALLCATVPLIVRIADHFQLPPAAGWTGALLYALAPVTGVSSTSAYNDGASVFFTCAAVSLALEKRWAMSGLVAGFAYAVKMPGLIVPAALALLPLAGKDYRGFVRFAAASLAGIAPWMLRAWAFAGNPVAPLFNGLFPNYHFLASAEQTLHETVQSYGGVAWTAMPRELAISGYRLQGLFGPALLLAPLALMALRRREGRALLGIAAVLALPWVSNIGARFLMPAIPFLGMALAVALPGRALPVLIAFHAISCWPAVVDRYASPHAWRLHGFPVKAALRIEPEQEFLERVSWDYRAAQMISRHVKRGETLLDLYGLHSAYLPVLPLGPLPSTRFDTVLRAIQYADAERNAAFRAVECRFPTQWLRGATLRLPRASAQPWVVNDVELGFGEDVRRPAVTWSVQGWPATEDPTLAFDGSVATVWRSADSVPQGAFLRAEFGRPQPVDRVTVIAPAASGAPVPEIYVQRMDRRWVRACESPQTRPAPKRSLRREAIDAARGRGVEWVVISASTTGLAQIGHDMHTTPFLWGLSLVDRYDNLLLFRVLR